MAELNPARAATTIAIVVLVVGAAVLFFFRFILTPEGLFKVQNAIGIEAVPPEHHVVAEGFRGWAVLRYGVEGAPELETVDGVLVIEYPPSGRFETSTPLSNSAGLLHKGYFERKGDAIVPLERLDAIWGEYTMTIYDDDEGGSYGRFVGFFVGTLSEFRGSERPRPDSHLPAEKVPWFLRR